MTTPLLIPGLPICMRCRQAVTSVRWEESAAQEAILLILRCGGHNGAMVRSVPLRKIADGPPVVPRVAFDEQGQAVSPEREPEAYERWLSLLLPKGVVAFRSEFTVPRPGRYLTEQKLPAVKPLLTEQFRPAVTPLLPDMTDRPRVPHAILSSRGRLLISIADYWPLDNHDGGLLMALPGEHTLAQFDGAPAYECDGHLYVGDQALRWALKRCSTTPSHRPLQIIRWCKPPKGSLPNRVTACIYVGDLPSVVAQAVGAIQPSGASQPAAPTNVPPPAAIAAPKHLSELLQDAIDAGADGDAVGRVILLLERIWGSDNVGKARWLQDHCGPIGGKPLDCLRRQQHAKVIAYLKECVP